MPRGRIRWGAGLFVAVALFIAVTPAWAGSPKVAALQAALKAKGLYTAEVDGVAGPLTRAATMRFQRRNRLTVDGVAGPRTRRALGRRGRPALGSRVLAPPAVGWDVAMLQFLLWREGYSPGAIDGALRAGHRAGGLRVPAGRRHRGRRPGGHARRSARCGAAPGRIPTRPSASTTRSRGRWATASVTLPAAVTRASTSRFPAAPRIRAGGRGSSTSRGSTRAATAISSCSGTGSASRAGTRTWRGSPCARGRP